MKLGFLASHGGTSMQAILAAIAEGDLAAEAGVVISNNHDSSALNNAREQSIPAFHLSQTVLGPQRDLDAVIAATLAAHDVSVVILSGYMRKLGTITLSRYRGRILNVHPGPLPQYGGRGMYGRHVHEAVLADGAATTAVTIHIVDGKYDRGPIVAQKSIAIETGETPDSLMERVKDLESGFFVETLQKLANGEISL